MPEIYSAIRIILIHYYPHLLDGSTGLSISRHTPESPPHHSELLFCNRTYALMAGRSKEELLARKNVCTWQEHGECQKSHQDQGWSKKKEEGFDPPVFPDASDIGVPTVGLFRWHRPDGERNLIESLAFPVSLHGDHYTVTFDKYLIPPRPTQASVRLAGLPSISSRKDVALNKGALATPDEAMDTQRGRAEQPQKEMPSRDQRALPSRTVH